jgi:hypothetical protein
LIINISVADREQMQGPSCIRDLHSDPLLREPDSLGRLVIPNLHGEHAKVDSAPQHS